MSEGIKGFKQQAMALEASHGQRLALTDGQRAMLFDDNLNELDLKIMGALCKKTFSDDADVRQRVVQESRQEAQAAVDSREIKKKHKPFLLNAIFLRKQAEAMPYTNESTKIVGKLAALLEAYKKEAPEDQQYDGNLMQLMNR